MKCCSSARTECHTVNVEAAGSNPVSTASGGGNMTKAQKAYDQGYRAMKDGEVIGKRGKLLSLSTDARGYPAFSIRLNGIRTRVRVHRLVAYQKFGEALFEDGIEVRHLDNDRQNSSWDNIAVGTKHENRMDLPSSVRHRAALKAGRANSPLDEKAVQDIRRKLDDGATYREVMAEYGIAKSTTSYIKNRITWQDV